MKNERNMFRFNATLIKRLTTACAMVATAYFFPTTARASVRTKIPISQQQLFEVAINPKEIVSAQFVHFKRPVAAMLSDELEIANPVRLTGVQSIGSSASGVWLRSRCSPNSALVFEECKGSVCSQMANESKINLHRHRVELQGQFGVYSFAAQKIGSNLTGREKAHSSMCNLVWPTWAVGARKINRELPLNVPRNLLLIQTQNNLYWYDANNRKLWNKMTWPLERTGQFMAAESSDDGRILLKTNNGRALYFDFSRGHALYLNQDVIQSAEFGLNGAFGLNAWSTQSEIIALQNYQSERIVDVNLGGIWWSRQYITWNSIALTLAIRKTPESIIFKNGNTLLHASWNDSSGNGKSHLLFSDGRQLTRASMEDYSSEMSILGRHSLDDFSEQAKAWRLIPTGTLFSAITNESALIVLDSKEGRYQIAPNSKSRFVMLGDSLFAIQPEHDGKCRMLILQCKPDSSLWTTGINIEHGACGVGAGLSTHASSIVEFDSLGINIHVLFD